MGVVLYGIMTEELVISEIGIHEPAGDSDSRMTSFEVIMPLKLQSTMKALLHYNVLAGNSWKRMMCLD